MCSLQKDETKRVCVYAGSFDPFTNGHLWMVEAGAKLFDKLIVAIGDNPDKSPRFSQHVRMMLIRECTNHLPNVEVANFSEQYLITYAHAIGAPYILRGVRSLGDYTYESTMLEVNRVIGDDVETVFLMPPMKLACVSSSMVKGLIGPQGWESVVAKYVPPAVLVKLKEGRHE